MIPLSVTILVAGALAVWAIRHGAAGASAIRPSGIPAEVSTPLANLMGLAPVPVKPAPDFRLTDQHGHPLSLASLRGRVVVLEFMDPHCTDICPLVSQEFVDAYHDLGPTASKVAFVAINVNQYYRTPAVLARFSVEHGLETIPSWRFVSGPVPALRMAWRDYGVEVSAPNPNADIVHSSILYFIGPDGTERYVASPMVDHTPSGASYLPAGQLASWGHGIALVARQLAR